MNEAYSWPCRTTSHLSDQAKQTKGEETVSKWSEAPASHERLAVRWLSPGLANQGPRSTLAQALTLTFLQEVGDELREPSQSRVQDRAKI